MRNIDAKDGNGLSDEITFQIQINLKNDNGPTRVNDNVLSVVTNGIKEPVNLKVIFLSFFRLNSMNFRDRNFRAEIFETEFLGSVFRCNFEQKLHLWGPNDLEGFILDGSKTK